MDGGDEERSESVSITSIDLSRNDPSVADLTGKVHQLPCCIKYDGPTAVSDYFKPKPTGMEIDGLRTEEAYFRGRKLHGAAVQIPQGYSGKMSEETNEATPTSVRWKMNASFRDVTVWNDETTPSKNDAFFRAFHCFTVADALHGQQVTAQDLDSIKFDF